MSDDLIGQRLGAFTIKSLLGQGGMARVYRAHQHSLEREVALKVIRRIPGDAQDVVARFQREKQVMQKLEHGNILPIYDYASNADYLWIAMRLVEGGTLGDHPVAPEKTASIVRQLASALDFAHSLGVIHRDIKPCNVLVEKGGDHLYLTDFGVAKMLEQEGLTAPGTTVGTPEYMSPEQLQGKELDGRSDQYSLAVMAYQFATGKLPFEGSLLEVMTQHMKATPVSPSKVNPKLPEAASQAILKALSKNPADRFETTVQFAQVLEAAIQGTNTAIPAATTTTGSGSSKMPLILGGVVCAAVAAGLFLRPGANYKPGPLVFEARSKNGNEVQLRSADGRIVSLGVGKNPHFWPGGEKLFLYRNQQLVVQNLQEKKAEKLISDVGDAALAPDASRLVFHRNRALMSQALKEGKAQGKPEILIEEGIDPSFSPDGSDIAYASDRAIWIINLESGRRSSLTAPPAGDSDRHPHWSGDGKSIVYQRKSSKNSELRVTRIEGTGQESAISLPQDCGPPDEPSWSPNSLVVFCSPKGIYSVAPDGTHLQRLVEPPAGVNLGSPEWGP